MSRLENYKKITDVSKLEELYEKASLKASNHRNELQLIYGIKKYLFFDSLTDAEKIDFRIRNLHMKLAFRQIYSELEIRYEELVVKLSKILLDFIQKNTEDLINYEGDKELSSERLAIIRLRTMLSLELMSLNRHLNLANGGHVLFKDIVEPIFIELENTEYYKLNNLEDIKTTYREVQELHDKKPYENNITT